MQLYIIIPTNAFKITPPIETCPDSRRRRGKNPNKKRLNSGKEIKKQIIKTNTGYFKLFIILSLSDAPLRLIPIEPSMPFGAVSAIIFWVYSIPLP